MTKRAGKAKFRRKCSHFKLKKNCTHCEAHIRKCQQSKLGMGRHLGLSGNSRQRRKLRRERGPDRGLGERPSDSVWLELMCRLERRTGASRAAFVGDTSYDIGAARAAGLPVVAVSFGFCDKPVHTLGADAVIDHFDELIPALVRLG
jgi:hypothetical protein